jgi:hypothetical protein
MAKYINKTQPTTLSPEEFIKSTSSEKLLSDSLELLKFFTHITGKQPVIWGKIVGFGKYHYTTKSCDADWFVTGFATRANEITIYCMCHFESLPELVSKLGKCQAKNSCLHIKKLSDIDLNILEQIIIKNQEYMVKNFKVE